MKQQQEQALLAAFRLMDDDEREFFLDLGRMKTAGRTSRRPMLQLIETKPAPPNEALTGQPCLPRRRENRAPLLGWHGSQFEGREGA